MGKQADVTAWTATHKCGTLVEAQYLIGFMETAGEVSLSLTFKTQEELARGHRGENMFKNPSCVLFFSYNII